MTATSPHRRVVTGAAGGIGSAVVRHLLQHGDEVVGIDHDGTALDGLSAELAASGRFSTAVVDLAQEHHIADAIGKIGRRLGSIDAVVNAAGVISRHAIRDLEVSEWDRVISINLRAPFVVTKACLDFMSEGSVVVNITSIQAIIANGDLSHYAASKGGLSQLTKALAVALAPEGIRVVAIAPGTTATKINERRRQDPAVNAAYLSRIPLSRLVEPSEIAEAVAFVLSDSARSITGSTIVVDGGLLATR